MGTLTVKSLVQEFAGLRGLPVPSAVYGATDKNSTQYLAILNAVLRKLMEYSWQEQRVQSTFTATATQNQGNLATLLVPSAPTAFDSYVQGSMWCTDRKIPVIGPVTDQEWAVLTALALAGPPYTCWMGGGDLHLSPIPTAGETFSAIYTTRYGIVSGGSPSQTIQSDNDTFLFPDDVMLKGFEAIWKKQKGEAYVDDWNDFIGLIAKRKINLATPALQLDEPARHNQGPRIFIPIGNWPV